MAAFVRAGIPEHYVGLSTDVKPTGVPVNSRAYETDTGAEYLWNGTAWVAYAPTSYQGATVFSGHLTPSADNTYDLGSAALSFRSIYVDTIVYATSVSGNWSPSANNTYDLGTTALGWRQGYFTGKLFVGDTLNANMTTGLTINQGATGNQAFCVKASGVATGLGNATAAILAASSETDDYFSMAPWSASLGGACMMALGEDSASLTRVMVFGAVGGRADTTKTTAGVGLVSFTVSQHDGANALADVAADGNIFSIRARVGGSILSRWILDEDGDTIQTGGVTTGAANSYINDTANAKMTTGLTINQGAADDEILSLKSSDVSSGWNGTEEDTFGFLAKYSATAGGLAVWANVESGSTGLTLSGITGAAAVDTTKSTAGRAMVETYASKQSGGFVDVTADGNIFAARARVGGADLSEFIVGAGGNTWQNGSATATSFYVGANQVVGARVVDARCDDAINSGDATTDGVIDALRDAMIAHGLIAAA